MMFNRFIVFLALAAATGASVASGDRGTTMHERKISAAVEQQLKDVVCVLKGFECEQQPHGEKLALYSTEQDHDVNLYVISASRRQLARVRDLGDGHYHVEQMWNAAHYFSSTLKPAQVDDFIDGGVSIYPALYPIAPGRQAIAIVQYYFTVYIRGGADFYLADFVELRDDTARLDESLRLFSDVPFSCEYSPTPGCASGHCEHWTRARSNGYLTLKFEKTAKHDLPDWLLTWHEFDTPDGPAGTVKTKKSTNAAHLVVGGKDNETELNKLRKKFCTE